MMKTTTTNEILAYAHDLKGFVPIVPNGGAKLVAYGQKNWVPLYDLILLLEAKAVRLLRNRAGGRPQMFEAGMLYQCLLLLNMPEFDTQKQVDELCKVTCRSFNEKDAKTQLKQLLDKR
ncbi:MAG: hypothetical protein NT043_01575 [Candidatus Bathyarchaeota archaeon]|nr:hypothetical protein [Candidatus Bathyarchaeota archaeon]